MSSSCRIGGMAFRIREYDVEDHAQVSGLVFECFAREYYPAAYTNTWSKAMPLAVRLAVLAVAAATLSFQMWQFAVFALAYEVLLAAYIHFYLFWWYTKVNLMPSVSDPELCTYTTPPHKFFVAVDSDSKGKERVLGCIGLRSEAKEDKAELFRFCVARQHRGTGVSWALFKEVVQHIQSLGHLKVTLWTSDGQPSALRFYSRLGFVTTERYVNEGPLPLVHNCHCLNEVKHETSVDDLVRNMCRLEQERDRRKAG